MTDAQRRKQSKAVYQSVLRTVDLNTGRMQPPLAKQSSVFGHLHAAGYGDYTHDEVHNAIVAACARGDLFRAKDDRERTYLGINDAAQLVEKIESNLEHAPSVNADVIGMANKRIATLRSENE